MSDGDGNGGFEAFMALVAIAWTIYVTVVFVGIRDAIRDLRPAKSPVVATEK